LTSFLRKISSGALNTMAVWLDRIGIQPNTLTVVGFLGHFAAAWFIAMGRLILGAVVLIFFGLFDALDGALARFQEKVSQFGAFLDSICDRFSEAVIFLGIFYFFCTQNSFSGCFMAFLAFISSVLVSYTRARAEAVGVLPKLGIMTRVERYIVLALALLFDQTIVGLALIAALGFFTVGQRIWFVNRQLETRD
jgi:CDP-diacylglycerol--glycerol-3-phosphate 3-phosphatidyltransferase